jgi:hypothetical protein
MVKYLDDTGLSGGVSIASLGGILATAEISAINGNKNAGAQTLLLNMATAVENATLTALGTYIAQAGVTAGAGVNSFSPAGLSAGGDINWMYGR